MTRGAPAGTFLCGPGRFARITSAMRGVRGNEQPRQEAGMDDALDTQEQRVARATGDASSESLGPGGNGERVVVARDITRRYGSGDAAVDALRGASVDLLRG